MWAEKDGKDGEDGTASRLDGVRGVRCSSEFSEMVSSMSTCSPQLRYCSSDDLRRGLRRRPERPSGLADLCITLGASIHSSLSEPGNEWARVICGADSDVAEDLDRT